MLANTTKLVCLDFDILLHNVYCRLEIETKGFCLVSATSWINKIKGPVSKIIYLHCLYKNHFKETIHTEYIRCNAKLMSRCSTYYVLLDVQGDVSRYTRYISVINVLKHNLRYPVTSSESSRCIIYVQSRKKGIFLHYIVYCNKKKKRLNGA